MSAKGINYYYDSLKLPRDSWKIFYDFNSGIVGSLPSTSGANPFYSGNFNTSGSYDFTGQHLTISNSETLNSDSWTMFFVFEKDNNNNGVLFSNYHGDDIKSGFAVGINSSNRIYLESYGDFGPSIYQSNIDLGSKNAVAINKSNDNLTINYFDFNTKSVLTNSFFIEQESIFESNGWTLGKAVNAPSYFSGDLFDGKIYSYIYITGNLFPYEIDRLFDGFYLSKAPEYKYDVVNESCNYSYLGLTGNVSSIQFDGISHLSYNTQTGYLINKTGKLISNMTGTVISGSGLITGSITGYVNQGSGYVDVISTPYSGFSGLERVVSGIRVFRNSLPSGFTSIDIQYPANFTGIPVVFTELEGDDSLLPYTLSGISSSGFSVNFSSPIGTDNYYLTTTAAIQQDNPTFKLQKISIDSLVDYIDVSFPSEFSGIPRIFCQLENNNGESLFAYDVSDVTLSGFRANFSNTINTNNYKLNYLATNLIDNDSFQISQQVLSSGSNRQEITFAASFASPPIVFGELVNSGNIILEHQVSGITSSGFTVIFSNTLSDNAYKFNTIAWSGVQSGVGYFPVTGVSTINLGQISDEDENIYQLSGRGLVVTYEYYDIAINRPAPSSGIKVSISSGVDITPIPINIPVNYNLSFPSEQTSNFVFSTNYSNNGDNFITANSSLYYYDTGIQSTPFYVYKNCIQLFGLVLEDLQYDTGYIYSFGMDGITYLNNTYSSDFSELYVFPASHNKSNLNIPTSINRTNGNVILKDKYSTGNLNLYLNGQSLIGGGYSYSGKTLIFNEDYLISGKLAKIDIDLNINDQFQYDVITGSRKHKYLPDEIVNISGNNYLLNLDVTLENLYLNGVKIVSGVDYISLVISGMSSVKILNTDIAEITGDLYTLPMDSEYNVRYTGNYNTIQTDRFARNTSILYVNGIRQKLDGQYIEIAKVGLLTGAKNTTSEMPSIFNNDFRFLE